MSIRRTIVATFKSIEQAEQAIKEIETKGLANNQISVVIRNRPANHEMAAELDPQATHPLEGLAGVLVQADNIDLGETGMVAAGGPVAGVLLQADKNIADCLEYYGVSRDSALAYQEDVKNGLALVVIETNNDKANQTANILDGYGGKQVTKWRKNRGN